VRETSIVLWITACELRIPTSQNPNQNTADFGGFFHKIKVSQPKGRQDSMQTVIPNKQEVGFILA
jgi:hypothetical protein